jgi:hypothetical protein
MEAATVSGMRPTLLASPSRPLTPRCRGGVSSLLRLTPTGSARSSNQSCSWAQTATQALAPFLPTEHDHAPLFTALQPSPGVVHLF